jgi:uncharacterized protein YciI
MRTRIMLVPLLIVVAVLAMLAGGRIVNSQQPAATFACVYKVTSEDLRKNGPRPADMPAFQGHVKYLKDLAEQGTSLFSGHTLNNDQSAFGILVVRADSEAAARKIMEADPIVHAGLVQGTVIPFGVGTLGKDASALK